MDGDCPANVAELRKRLHAMEQLVQRQHDELVNKVTRKNTINIFTPSAYFAFVNLKNV